CFHCSAKASREKVTGVTSLEDSEVTRNRRVGSVAGGVSVGSGCCTSRPIEHSGLDSLKRAVDDCLQFGGVLDLASLGQNLASFGGREPGRIAHCLPRRARGGDFHQEGFDHEFLYACRLPKHAFGMNVKVEMPGFDDANGPS